MVLNPEGWELEELYQTVEVQFFLNFSFVLLPA
jgi:hypothetical protein